MPPVVFVHVVAAGVALALGSWVLARPKGDAAHRRAGRVWLVAMFLVIGTSFFITGLNGERWSPIHGLSLFTLAMLVLAIWRIRRGDVAGHRRALIGSYVGLVAAGLGALAPGRTLAGLLW